jgi:hypothetical protein
MYKVYNTKNVFENEFQNIFFVVFFLIINSYFGNPKLYFCIMQESPFAKFIRLYGKSYFILKTCF